MTGFGSTSAAYQRFLRKVNGTKRWKSLSTNALQDNGAPEVERQSRNNETHGTGNQQRK